MAGLMRGKSSKKNGGKGTTNGNHSNDDDIADMIRSTTASTAATIATKAMLADLIKKEEGHATKEDLLKMVTKEDLLKTEIRIMEGIDKKIFPLFFLFLVGPIESLWKILM